MPEKKIEGMSDLDREEHLTKHLLIIHMELQDVINQMDEQPMRMTGIIGGRIQLINEMFRELHKDQKYKDRFFKYIQEINEITAKRAEVSKNYPGTDKPTYMG